MNLATQTSLTSDNNGAGGDSDGTVSASGGGGGPVMPSTPTPTPGTSTPQRSMGNFYGEQQSVLVGTPPSSAKFMGTASTAGMCNAVRMGMS